MVAQHDVERAGKVVGEGATVALIHEGQQEAGEEQQGEEEEPQRERHAAHSVHQLPPLNTQTRQVSGSTNTEPSPVPPPHMMMKTENNSPGEICF